MQPDTKKPLPGFETPPVNEVICGIMFTPLERLLVPHVGRLWEKFRAEYPTCKEADPIVPVFETFDGGERPSPDLAIPFLPRVWFISKDDNAIIQVQRDRFLHNWRKVRPSDEYPRYGNVRKQFEERLSAFREFVTENQLGSISPLQFEMTYLNHIPLGQGWEKLSDIGNVFPDLLWRSEREFLTAPERIAWRTAFPLPEQLGRLHVSVTSGTRRPDSVQLLVFELTVRGIGVDRSLNGVWTWLDTAREWIVRGFADLTGTEVHEKFWKRVS
jgi:uncharacterized protein (TIGR04255 family)